jgi:hypothetical protein
VTSNNHVHHDSWHVTHPLSLGWQPDDKHSNHLQQHLLPHLKSSSLLYEIRVDLMAPQPPSHVNLVTPPLQMDHFDFFSAPRAPLLVLLFLPRLFSSLALSFKLLPRTPSTFPLFLDVTRPAIISCLEFEDARSEQTHITHRVVSLLPFLIPATLVPATITWPNNLLIPHAKTQTVSRPELHP